MSETPRPPDGVGPDDPTQAFAPRSQPPQASTRIPARVGRYTILRVLGEGGMGLVYEAEQESPRRRVALKVIRAGYMSPDLLRRFAQESQVLGRLQHPGIAQVYEAGTVEDEHGRPTPFFAMEFIQGVDLTAYAASSKLGTSERLELVARICDAVYHAHQKGVIHRDLKPGNILVDQNGQPRILDFGIARATDSDVQQTTMRTDVGQIIGTVPYMSPEQVSGDASELDTRSDVYALGVIAYEFLAGRLPFNLERKMIHEAARMIREEEPTRLSSIDRTLRGDVETIVAKALEKDKTRRYQSAESLAADIRRYLRDEPISARPASAWYQIRKFSRRNRGLVGGTIAAALMLVAGVVASMIFAAREHTQRGLADQSARDAQIAEAGATRNAKEAAAQARESRRQLRISTAVQDFLTKQILARTSPYAAGGKDITMRDVLAAASAEVEGAFAGEPEVEAGVRSMLGLSYTTLGDWENATRHLDRALRLQKEAGLEESDAGLMTRISAAELLIERGAAKEAESKLREILAACERTGEAVRRRRVDCLGDLARACTILGKPQEGETFAREGMQLLDPADTTGFDLIHFQWMLASAIMARQGPCAQAEAHLREALAIDERRGRGKSMMRAGAKVNLAECLRGMPGKLEEAQRLLAEAVEISREILPRGDANFAATLNSLGMTFALQGRFDAAERCHREAMEIRERLFGKDDAASAQVVYNLANALTGLKRLDDALVLARHAADLAAKLPNDPSNIRALSMALSGRLLSMLKKHDEAVAMLREAIGVLEADQGHTPRTTARELYDLHVFLAISLASLDKFAQASQTLNEAWRLSEQGAQLPPAQRTGFLQMAVKISQAWEKAEPGKGAAAVAEWKGKE